MIFKKSKGCAYCRERYKGFRNVLDGQRWTKVVFNYCPLCGRKMKTNKGDKSYE